MGGSTGVAVTHALDNVVWHALTGPNRSLGEVRGHAARLHPDVGPFAAVCDEACEQGWADLAALAGPGRGTTLFRPALDLPDGWTLQVKMPCLQMVAENGVGAPDDRFEVLGPQDVPEMLALVAETQPGPFMTRTIELGTYLGYRVDGELVAMAGERIRCDGATEISAVCTKESHRGQGLGGALTLAVAHVIQSRGDRAFLHVMTTNTSAISVYERTGFTVRMESDAVILRTPGAA